MNVGFPKEDAFDVSDSTDWLETPLASLSPVDSALRCQVCKDFYTTPMITSCAHTFCSLCIRRCLSSDGKCPACRAKDQELKLRFNGAMEELVQAYVKARPEILAHAKDAVEVQRSTSPKRRIEEVDADIEGRENGPRKRTRSSGKKLSSQKIMVVDSEEDSDEYVPRGFVHCPICKNEVKEDRINAHLDQDCQEKPTAISRKPSIIPLKSLPPTKPTAGLERLAQINYSMLKDGPLRKKLTDQGLSAAGNRQLLMQRYTEWVTLWNANCDATKPKTKLELKREMDIWERTQGGRAPSSYSHSGTQIRDKDFDSTAWSTKHDGDFRSLIANARKTTKPSTTEDAKPPLERFPDVEARNEVEDGTQALLNYSSPILVGGEALRIESTLPVGQSVPSSSFSIPK